MMDDDNDAGVVCWVGLVEGKLGWVQSGRENVRR